MRPYLAILKDSFREALASRVMLVTLLGIVAVLALLAPFGLDVGTSYEFRRSEIVDAERLLNRLRDESGNAGTPVAHLWSLLSEEQQSAVDEWLDPNADQDLPPHRRSSRRIRRRIVRCLNDLIKDDDFYDEAVWSDVDAGDEAAELTAKPNRSNDEQRRLNLVLTAAMFPRSIELVDSQAFSLTYGTAVVQGPIPLTPTQFQPIFDQVLIAVVSTFLGFFGVFGCLLVTASLIPRTFEPGEISLLLSKPVRRSALFVVKFIGGCVFTLLYSSVLVFGIWLLLGVRMDYWRHSLLWCIPVYVLLFMIYYAVSAVAGAIWRHSTVALTLVVVFWLFVTVIGVTQQALKEKLFEERGIRGIVSAGSEVLTVDGEDHVWAWDDSRQVWRKVFEAPPDRMGGLARFLFGSDERFLPVHDPTTDRILAIQQTRSRFGAAASTLVAGRADEDWERVSLGQIPEFVPDVLIGSDGRIILPGRHDIYRFLGQSDLARRQADFLRRMTGGLLGGGGNAFESLQIKGLADRAEDFAATINRRTNNVWLFSDGTLQRLDTDENGTYSAGPKLELPQNDSGVIAADGDYVIVGLQNGHVEVFHSNTLQSVATLTLASGSVPRLATAGSGALAIVTSQRTLVFFDPDSKRLQELPEQSVCSAVALTIKGQMLTANGRLAVTAREMADPNVIVQVWAESEHWVYQLYDWLIRPAWKTLPKPAQLDECVKFVMQRETVSFVPGQRRQDARTELPEELQTADDFDPWVVLRDNTIFVVIMLGFGCVYISRRDF